MKFLDLFKRQASPYTAKRAPLAAALEPRMLFDGAVAATVADAAVSDSPAAQDPTTDNTDHQASDALTPPAATSDQRQEIVFVDGGISDYQQLVSGLKPGTEVVVLDASKDGLQQIADYLKDRSDVDAIHLLSHGAQGTVELGNLWLNSQNIDQHAQQLNAIGAALAADGDILIYGCDTGKGAQGATLLGEIARLTQADVAASADATGATSKGGNWVLESRNGQLASKSLQVDTYGALLAAPADENFDDNPTQEIRGTNTFVLDGFRYTITGPGGTNYDHFLNDVQYAPAGQGLGPDNYLRFDVNGIGATSITIEVADGSAFRLMSLSFFVEDDTSSGGPSESFTITPAGGSALTYLSDTTYQNVDFSNNTGFYNITSITFSSQPGKVIYLDIDDLNVDAPITNTAPSVANAIPNQNATEDAAFNFQFAANTFSDVDVGDTLTYSAQLSGGGALPAWLSFNAATRTFSGTPTNGNVGTVSIDVIASDGNGGMVTDTFHIVVANTNDAPTVTNAIPNQNASEDAAFNFQFAANTFSDVDYDTLTYSAQLAGGGALPAWLSFNPATRTFSGTPSDSDVGTISIDVIASDGNGGMVTDTFNITIADTNATPAITNVGGDSVAWGGAGNTVRLDVNNNASLADVELGALNGGNGDWAGASLAIQRSGTAVGSDVLGFDTDGALFTVSGSNLQRNGLTFATFTNSGGVLNISFTSSGTTATTALVNDVAQRITYRNDTPAGDATLAVTLNDGAGGSASANVTVASDTIYVTNATDTANIDRSNGVSFSEAVAIAAADSTGSQTIVFASSLAGQTLSLNPVSLNESLTFDLDQASGLILTGGPLSLAGGTTQTFTNGSGDTATISSVVAGSGSLNKSGSGNLTLTANNTSTGSSTVFAGTLIVDGNTSSTTTVASGATLAGSGSLGGNVTVQSGGTLSPGSGGAGSLNINGNLSLAAGSTLALDINGTTAGSGYDRVLVNGSASLSGATLAVTHGYTAGTGDRYTVIVNDGGDAITGTFTGVSEGGTITAGGNGTGLTASYAGGTGNDLTLTAPAAPVVTNITSDTANGTYKIGDVITVTVQFDTSVNVTGTPTLTLETGATDRIINYVSGSGTDTLIFSYTVQAGDISADLDYAPSSALSLWGGTIQNGANQNAILTLPTPGAAGSLGANKALVVDGVRPTATSITLSDTALRIGETATVTITFNEAVSGLTPVDFSVANGALSNLASVDGGITWTATLTPGANVTAAGNLITLDNTGYTDAAGNTGSGSTDSNSYSIDTQRPSATLVVADSTLKAGQSTTVTITFNEAVSGLTPADFSVANGALSNLGSVDGGITWTATLTPGANVTAAGNLITLDNTGYTDAAGNTGSGSTDSNSYSIDTQRPSATLVVADSTLKAGQSTTVTITFSEAVSGLATADFSVANGALSDLASSDGGITWTATLTPSANVTDASNLITLDNTGYTDAAGNTGSGSTDSNNYAIDSKVPAVTSVGVPANGTYLAGDILDFTVNFDEAVTVDTSGGTPRLAITLDGGGTAYASYLSGSGSSTLVFRLTVANGQQDADGIAVASSLDTNGATLRDGAGNDVQTALNAVGSTSGVLVDATTPEVSTISLDSPSPTNASSVTFTVTFSEDVSGVDISDFSLATTGSVNATLQSLVQIDAHTYRITVDTITGLGELGLILNPNNANIVDGAGNTLTSPFTSQTYRIAEPVVTTSPAGDPEFRINPPPAPGLPQTPLLQPQVPGLVTNPSAPPLAFPSLFEVRTVGGDLKPLSTIFLGNGATAPSFIAQVFGSSDTGLGGASGFLGFGGGDGGVFGSSTFSSLFSHEVPGASEMNLFSGSQWKQSDLNQGLRGVFGVPTFGQQLHDLHDNEQRQVRELAQALGQFESKPVQA